MAETIVMLALSPTMETGTIVSWHKKEGERIKSGDVLCEVETDKATMDYESSNDGVLLKIVTPEGSQVKVGDPIGIVGEKGEEISSLLKQVQKRSPEALAAKPSVKATSEKPAVKEKVPPGEEAPPVREPDIIVRASPLAREIARQKRIDLRSVSGSGPRGRIVKEDVEKAAVSEVPSAAAEIPESRKEESVPVSQKREVIARRLSESKFSAPHYYLTISVCVDRIIEARKELNQGAKSKVSFNAFLIKLAAEALKRNPVVNSSWAQKEIIRHGSQDIGIAVALDDGLITPIVRDCGSKGIVAIDAELRELVERARSGRLTPQEYTGATFTISNLGSRGVRQFTAIINPPGSSILAAGEIFSEPVITGTTITGTRSMMLLTLSNDHRVIDGAVAAQFAADLKKMMESPITVLY